MTTPNYINGAEHGIVNSRGGSASQSVAGNFSVLDNVSGNITVVTPGIGVDDLGTRAYRLAPTASVGAFAYRSFGSIASQPICGRFKVAYTTLPTARNFQLGMVTFNATSPCFGYNPATSTLQWYTTGSGTSVAEVNLTGVTFAINTWYEIEFRYIIGTGQEHTVEWRCNGIDQPTLLTIDPAGYIGQLRAFQMGGNWTGACDYMVDDVTLWLNDTEFDSNLRGSIQAHVPNSNTTATGFNQQPSAGGALTAVVANSSYQYVDEIPHPIATGDNIQQGTAGGTSFVEFGFNWATAPSGRPINGIALVETLSSSATTANSQAFASEYAGTVTTFYSGTVGQTTSLHKQGIVPEPAGGWPAAPDVMGRWGYAGDVNPIPRLEALALEVVYAPVQIVTYYARAAGGDWSSASTWSLSSNGPADGAVPTANSNVILDAFSGSVTIGSSSIAKSIDMTGYTATLAFNAQLQVLGDVTLGGTLTGTSTLFLRPPTGTTALFTSNGKLLPNPQLRVGDSGTGNNGTVRLVDHLNVTGQIHVAQATFDAATNNVNVTADGLNTEATSTTVINMGNGTWTLNSATYIAWTINASGNITINPGLSTITQGTPVAGWTFNGGGKSYNNLTVTSGSNLVSVTGSNTFANLTISGNREFRLASGTTTTVTNSLDLAGTSSAARLSVTSSTAGTAATISKSSGTVLATNVSLKDNIGTGGATFRYDSGSVVVSNVTGWSLAAPSTAPVLSGTAGDGSVSLSWTASSGSTWYEIEQDGSLVDGTDGLSHGITGLTNGTSYTYRVRGTNDGGVSPWSNSIVLTPSVSVFFKSVSDTIPVVEAIANAVGLPGGTGSGGRRIVMFED